MSATGPPRPPGSPPPAGKRPGFLDQLLIVDPATLHLLYRYLTLEDQINVSTASWAARSYFVPYRTPSLHVYANRPERYYRGIGRYLDWGRAAPRVFLRSWTRAGTRRVLERCGRAIRTLVLIFGMFRVSGEYLAIISRLCPLLQDVRFATYAPSSAIETFVLALPHLSRINIRHKLASEADPPFSAIARRNITDLSYTTVPGSATRVPPRDVAAFGAFCPDLRSLTLGCASTDPPLGAARTDTPISALAALAALSGGCRLVSIDIVRWGGVDGRVLRLLARNCPQLRHLNVRAAGVRDGELLEMARRLPGLRTLKLHRCVFVSDAAFARLATVFAELETVLIESSRISAGGVAAFVRATGRDLHLMNSPANPLEDAAAGTGSPTLRYLTAAFGRISDAGLGAFAGLWPRLEMLDLETNQGVITEDGKGHFQSARPDCLLSC